MPLLLMLLFQQAVSAPPEPAASSSASWSNFRAAVNQQSLQTVLVSIEERLRALDTLYSPRYTPRWEVSIEQQSRRMETIESRLGRLETLLELRLDKLSETMSARQLKEELAKDQIHRKLDSTYERLNHRLGYLEARLDVGITKLQSTIEGGIGRIERLETTTMSQKNEIETQLTDIGSGIDHMKKQLAVFEERYNTSFTAIVEHGKHMATEMNNLTTRVEDLHVELNKSGSEQNDEEGNRPQKTLNTIMEKITNNIDRQANNFITKANNMYNDIWRRTQTLEGLAKDTMSLSNATRREVQDGLRTLALQIGRRGLFQSDRERQEGSMDIALDTLGHIQRRLNELGRKFDSSFQMLMLTQNLFLESCHRIQLDEPQMETKLTRVLERILDTITNRSMTTDRELLQIEDLLKSHGAHMTRSIGHTTSTLTQSSDKVSRLQVDLLATREQLLEGNKYIEDAISDIREEKLTISEKIDSMVSAIQEIQDSIAEISTSNQAEHKIGYSCPDGERIAMDILTAMQRNMENSRNIMRILGFNENNTDNENIIGEEENIMEGRRNSSNDNISNFQVQHRFNIQTNRNHTFQVPHEVINIIQDGRNTTEHDKPQGFSENVMRNLENPLLPFDLQNVAAIIQDSDAQERNKQPILTIVHTIINNMSATNSRENMNETISNINPTTNINTVLNVNHTKPKTIQNNSTEEEKIESIENVTETSNGTRYNTSIEMVTHTNSSTSTRDVRSEQEIPTSQNKLQLQTPEILKKILESEITEQKHNISDEEILRLLIGKLQKSLNVTTESVEPKQAISTFITDTDEVQSITENGQLQDSEWVSGSTNPTNEETEEMLDR